MSTEIAFALKFAERPRENAIAAAVNDQTAATVRYGLEHHPDAGDHIELQNADGERFGTAAIVAVDHPDVFEAVQSIRQHGARHPVGDAQELRAALNDYYGDFIGLNDRVTVLILDPEVDDG